MATDPAQRITVRVGETDFTTSRSTLAESSFFTALWSAHPPEQTEFFVDADPDLFKHVLRYLRMRVFPLFFDARSGHDVVMYKLLLHQARFYQIERLEAWLAHERYFEAIKAQTRMGGRTMYGDRQIQAARPLTCKPDETLTVLSSVEGRNKCWMCPSNNWEHYGHPEECNQSNCRNLPAWGNTTRSELRTVKITAVITHVVMNDAVLFPANADPVEPPSYNEVAHA